MKRIYLSSLLLFGGLFLSPKVHAGSPFPDGYQKIQTEYQHKALIRKFYQAFQNKDGPTMISCYHPEATFYDPVFLSLTAKETKAMWMMLLEAGGQDLRLEFKDISYTAGKGHAFWEALYPFSATGLKVHNQIQAQFEFKDGLIYRHKDTFDLHRWSSMALGPIGGLLGGTPFLQQNIQKLAYSRLAEFIHNHPEYQ